MIVEFKIVPNEPQGEGIRIEQTGEVHISASKETIDRIIEAIETVPN